MASSAGLRDTPWPGNRWAAALAGGPQPTYPRPQALTQQQICLNCTTTSWTASNCATAVVAAAAATAPLLSTFTATAAEPFIGILFAGAAPAPWRPARPTGRRAKWRRGPSARHSFQWSKAG